MIWFIAKMYNYRATCLSFPINNLKIGYVSVQSHTPVLILIQICILCTFENTLPDQTILYLAVS